MKCGANTASRPSAGATTSPNGSTPFRWNAGLPAVVAVTEAARQELSAKAGNRQCLLATRPGRNNMATGSRAGMCDFLPAQGLHQSQRPAAATFSGRSAVTWWPHPGQRWISALASRVGAPQSSQGRPGMRSASWKPGAPQAGQSMHSLRARSWAAWAITSMRVGFIWARTPVSRKVWPLSASPRAQLKT